VADAIAEANCEAELMTMAFARFGFGVFRYAVWDSKVGVPEGLVAATAVAAEDALAEPTELDAVTVTRTVRPASALPIT
jgi:hypothetical protein